MEAMLQCLLYVVKSLEEVELPDSVAENIAELLSHTELELRSENDRLQEIKSNLQKISESVHMQVFICSRVNMKRLSIHMIACYNE